MKALKNGFMGCLGVIIAVIVVIGVILYLIGTFAA